MSVWAQNPPSLDYVRLGTMSVWDYECFLGRDSDGLGRHEIVTYGVIVLLGVRVAEAAPFNGVLEQH